MKKKVLALSLFGLFVISFILLPDSNDGGELDIYGKSILLVAAFSMLTLWIWMINNAIKNSKIAWVWLMIITIVPATALYLFFIYDPKPFKNQE